MNNIMGRNFVAIQDNLLTKKECADAIQWILDNDDIIKDPNYMYSQYHFCNLYLNDRFYKDIKTDPCRVKGKSFGEAFSPLPLRPLINAIIELKELYQRKYPEVERVDPWDLEYVRFKWWKPGEFYHAWHSEHGVGLGAGALKTPQLRVLSFLICLSDNDSYTEFRRYRNVRTRAGRGIIFPAYHTHEHRGSLCKKALDRYMLGGYFSFLTDG